MKNSQKGASILYVGSIAGGPRAINNMTIYGMSKAGYKQLAANLACEWAKDGIRVNCIAPGFIATELSAELQNNKEYFDDVMSKTPMARFGQPDEIANVCVFLSSAAASYVSGVTLAVDGAFSPCGAFF